MKRLIAFLFITTGMGCTQVGFEAQKDDVLTKTSVMDDVYGTLNQGGNEDGNGTLNQGGNGNQGQGRNTGADEDDETSVTVNPDGTAGDTTLPPYMGETPGRTEEPVVRVCSDNQSKASPNYKGLAAAGGDIAITVNNKPCTNSLATIDRLVRQANISVADLRAACGSSLPAKGALITQIRLNGATRSDGLRTIEVLWARNKDKTVSTEAADEYCTKKASPLVVHMRSEINLPRPIALSSIDQGIQFDLLGARNAHRKVQIGWFTNLDYRMLALPDARGRVRGIDQLFGDSTRGPDGKFAANGYAALAKYDGTTSDGHFHVAAADGIIDANDPIFGQLRLWLDSNFDGSAQASELTSLRSAGLSYIDLRYSSDYSEIDSNGNETKMKSVVGFIDGSMDLIFDLWFAYRPSSL